MIDKHWQGDIEIPVTTLNRVCNDIIKICNNNHNIIRIIAYQLLYYIGDNHE